MFDWIVGGPLDCTVVIATAPYYQVIQEELLFGIHQELVLGSLT